jgi:hypothetical protein
LFARRGDPALALAFSEVLRVPRPIDQVEGVELLAKLLWDDVLRGVSSDPELIRLAIDFFHEMGFLCKYKSYGVKVASPFGYSLFVLEDGRGFSFQLHAARKLEAFHILETAKSSFVYLSSEAEWYESGAREAQDWAEKGYLQPESVCAYRPTAGDVIEVGQTQLVHTVVGCVLEEFATCSTDTVVRLFDQNAGQAVMLPETHLDIASILRRTAWLPRRKLSRAEGGWSAVGFQPDSPLIDVRGELTARRLQLPAPQSDLSFAPLSDRLVVVVPLNKSVVVDAVGTSWSVAPGETLAIPQNVAFGIHSTEVDSLFALHVVSSELALKDWR